MKCWLQIEQTRCTHRTYLWQKTLTRIILKAAKEGLIKLRSGKLPKDFWTLPQAGIARTCPESS